MPITCLARRRRVLRAVVLAAEQDGQEVCEELMQLYSARLLGQAGAVGGGSSTALLAAPQPQPGWCYKLYGYAPAGEPTAATWHRMGVLDRQAVERCQQEQQHWRQELDGQQQGEEDGEPGLLPPLPVTAGDARHGLLALHVSLNLLEGGTGCHEWEAGFWLAEWVLSHPQLAAGAGLGTDGVAAAWPAALLSRARQMGTHTPLRTPCAVRWHGPCRPLLPGDWVRGRHGGRGAAPLWRRCRRLHRWRCPDGGQLPAQLAAEWRAAFGCQGRPGRCSSCRG